MAACMHPLVSAAEQAPLTCEVHWALVFLLFQLPVDADEHVRRGAAPALHLALVQRAPSLATPSVVTC